MTTHNPDEYYNRSEVSNSWHLTALTQLYPRPQYGDREALSLRMVDTYGKTHKSWDFINKLRWWA